MAKSQRLVVMDKLSSSGIRESNIIVYNNFEFSEEYISIPQRN